MNTTKTNQPKPISNFQRALYMLERAHDELARASRELKEETQKTVELFITARDAAAATDQNISRRFMCGQWLFVFGEKGELEVTEIPNNEPFYLIELARAMGEEDS
ncbi:hypothetical protein [Pseudomonas sp. NPDC089569]|uniref:hypothetical protein n=1 Tax=Pseudomonas sp. NPDC089569 TaxID=3390722 RepID=UPI003D05504F